MQNRELIKISELTQTVKKPRIVWIDILRGAMMFFVVYGHCTARGDVSRFIFSFHMPIFFIISGMTFSFNREFDAKKYLAKKAKTLLAPYFLLNLYVVPLYLLNAHNGKAQSVSPLGLLWGVLISNVDSGYPMASNTTWFILCLFLTDLIFFAFRRLIKSDAILAVTVTSVTATFYALGFIREKGAGVWHWQTAFTAVIFYMCGYFFMKNIASIKELLLKSKWKSAIVAAVFLSDGYLLGELNGRVSMVNDSYNNTLFFYLSALMTSFAAVTVIILLSESRRFLRLMKPINFIGRTTLVYIAFHVPIMKVLKFYTPFGRKSEPLRLAMALLIYFAMIPLAWFVDKLLPKNRK
jgi:fucose 4-O-acetylase-like acetyltransferase